VSTEAPTEMSVEGSTEVTVEIGVNSPVPFVG
jgi:hypothetical protein